MRRALLAGLAAGAGLAALRALRRHPYVLEGKVAIVTGGTRGLGLLLARELGARGCRVAVCARDRDELDAAAADLESRGVSALAVRCDVTRPADLDDLVEAVEDVWGGVDVLVNNAGVIQVGPLETLDRQAFDRAMAVNFGGVLNATLAVLPQMRARGEGRILNVTSIGGVVSVPHLLPYSAAKFAAVGLSEGLRAELAREGIHVTTAVPGLMRTGSPVHAEFRGDHEAEMTWFALGDSLRLTSMDASRAARRMVDALERGEAHVTLSWQARAVRAAHAVAPGLVADALGVVNRLLPGAPPDGRGSRPRVGLDVATPVVPSRLTGPMNRAARRNHELVARPDAPVSRAVREATR